MTCKVYTHRQTHTLMYIHALFHITIKVNVCFSIITNKCSNVTVYDKFWLYKGILGYWWVVVDGCGQIYMVLDGFERLNDCNWLWVVLDSCGWLWVVVDVCGCLQMVMRDCILKCNPLRNLLVKTDIVYIINRILIKNVP